MKNIFISFCVILISTTMMSAAAEEKAAGCGIGKIVMQGKSGKDANIAAAFLNTIFPSTFFMTTGIMGCDTTQTVQKEQLREVFVAGNFDSLSRDMAQGGGDYLAALTIVMDVSQEDKADFFTFTQINYAALFNRDALNAKQVLASLDNALLSNPKLAKYVTR